jgi:pimeloyl-ACP methyl ester carboxylesterase
MTIMALIAVLLMSTLCLRARDATLAPPGKRYYVDNRKYQVHLDCVGGHPNGIFPAGNRTKTPTILLEGGEMPVGHSFKDWVHDAYEHGTIKRYCYWDRPGFAFSENAPSPHSAGMSADALSEVLAVAGEEGPFIVVSAGVGGIYGRIFSSRHTRDVQGIMLIDALHEDYLPQLGNPGRGFLLWLRGIFSPLGLDRLFGAIFKGRTREDRVYGKRAYQHGKFLKARLQENLVADSITKSEISSARHIQSPSTPLAVVSSGIEVDKSDGWAKRQEKLTKITNNLVAWDVVKDAPHQVWDTIDGRRALEKRLRDLLRARERTSL